LRRWPVVPARTCIVAIVLALIPLRIGARVAPILSMAATIAVLVAGLGVAVLIAISLILMLTLLPRARHPGLG